MELGSGRKLIDEGVQTRSRQLDFGGDDEEPEAEEAPSMRSRRGRRETLFWSAEEEEFLRRGVSKYGIGKWKKILLDGASVFSRHRTNVDLKDKWKNLKMPRHTTRKRRREENVPDSLSQTAANEERTNSEAVPVRAAKKRRAIVEEVSDLSSPESNETRCRPQSDIAVGCAVATVCEVEAPRNRIEIRFTTDHSYPEFVPISINLKACRDVAALKNVLGPSVLAHAPANATTQMIGIKSRELYVDTDPLTYCVGENGLEFYLVIDDIPDVFV